MFLIEKMEILHFSPSEEKIIDYILNEKETIADQSTSFIAQKTYSSKSSLVRIAKKLGFLGWTSFKDVYLEEVRYFNQQTGTVDANYPFQKTDNYLQIAHKIAALEKESIDETLSLLSSRQINQTLRLFKESKTIHLLCR